MVKLDILLKGCSTQKWKCSHGLLFPHAISDVLDFLFVVCFFVVDKQMFKKIIPSLRHWVCREYYHVHFVWFLMRLLLGSHPLQLSLRWKTSCFSQKKVKILTEWELVNEWIFIFGWSVLGVNFLFFRVKNHSLTGLCTTCWEIVFWLFETTWF